jgi:hypothetical protein
MPFGILLKYKGKTSPERQSTVACLRLFKGVWILFKRGPDRARQRELSGSLSCPRGSAVASVDRCTPGHRIGGGVVSFDAAEQDDGVRLSPMNR